MEPQIIKTINKMVYIRKQLEGKIGFIPTMGFLHEGHLSLIKEAKKKTDIVIVSIFVNPSQFGDNEDLSEYPRNVKRDIELLSNLEVDFLFLPTNEQMYPEGYQTWVNVEELTQVLCGRSRPYHFRGVTTIVTKLMNIVDPDMMFMGEKDFQQLVVLKQMVKDLNFRTKVIGCPIVREADGLALSSRNKYLSNVGRKNALCLQKSLILAQKLFNEEIVSSKEISSQMLDLIEENEGIVDYVEVIDPKTLKPIPKLTNGCRVALAVNIENTRLIDNIEII